MFTLSKSTFQISDIPRYRVFALCLMLSLVLMACNRANDGNQKADKTGEKKPNPTLITVASAETAKLENLEETVGSLEGLIDPTIAAETPGKVLKVLVHPGQHVRKGQMVALLDDTDYVLQLREVEAELARLQALYANQGKVVERNQALVQKNFISQHALEDQTTQQSAQALQIQAAKARLESIRHTASKARLISPVDGVVEKQIVTSGDFVRVGDPLVQIIGAQKLRAHLPFPEHLASRIHPGMPLRLSTPTSSKIILSQVSELKPMIGSSNRSIDVIADVQGHTDWQPGASVNGALIFGTQSAAVLVPELSVVLRPAGEVVYVISQQSSSQQARQRIIKTGSRQNGKVEILEGLSAGELVAVDGAAFLSDQALVQVKATEEKTLPLRSEMQGQNQAFNKTGTGQ